MMTKPNRKKKQNKLKWKPKFCIVCNELIKPDQKSASYQAASMTVYYFHEFCFNELLGLKVGGRVDTSKVESKVREAETKQREREEKQTWDIIKEGFNKRNHIGLFYGTPDKSQFRDEYMANPEQKICERCGLGMKKLTPESDVWICPNKHQFCSSVVNTGYKGKLPKAHVEEFEPSQDTKDDHLNQIIAEIRARGNLTSEKLAEFTGIKRSTITWRLWEHTVGNTKSKDNQELFYFDKGPKGVQFYGLVSERIKDPNIFAKARLRQQAKENGISYEEAEILYDVNFAKKEDLLDKAIKITPDFTPASSQEIKAFTKNFKEEYTHLLEEE